MKDKLLVLVLTAVLLSGGLMHASFKHDHGGHHHAGDISSIWSSLHSSLRHEDKQAAAAATESADLHILGTVASFASAALALLFMHYTALCRDPFARDALRKGRYRYRVFG